MSADDFIDKIMKDVYLYINTKLRPIAENCNEHIEGNIFEEDPNEKDVFLTKRKNIILTCQNKKNVLEIGFNTGYSALLILMSDPNIKLTCIDINIHKYVIPCYNQLKEDFGDRISLLTGDSTIVVPCINDKFDLVHIDGCHRLDIAEQDIINTHKLLLNNAVIVMDDVNIYDNNHTLAMLWKKYTNIYSYQAVPYELFHCIHHDIRCYTA